MQDLKSLLGDEERVWFDVASEYYPSFLAYAKDNGCKWMDGSEIDTKATNKSCFMGINKDLQLGFISCICWASFKEIKKIVYKN